MSVTTISEGFLSPKERIPTLDSSEGAIRQQEIIQISSSNNDVVGHFDDLW